MARGARRQGEKARGERGAARVAAGQGGGGQGWALGFLWLSRSVLTAALVAGETPA